MPQSYPDFYQRKREYLSEAVESGEVASEDKEAIEDVVYAFDEDRPEVPRPTWSEAPSRLTSYREASTLANWMYHLTIWAKYLTLTDTTAKEINQVAGKMIRGELADKDEITKGSARAYQNTARIFYRFHDDLGVDYDEIQVFEQQSTGVDPSDMLTKEEVEKVREAPDNPRDEAVVYLLLYTGLRNTALRTLRIGDIDLEKERFYFNTEADGLKDVSRPNQPRPLLGAVGAIRAWLRYHPDPDNEDAYLITGRPKWGRVDPTEPVSDRTISRVMEKVKEETGIDKPLHPHMMRHNFVSICKREYNQDNETVKFLIGHDPDSNVMSTTYNHLSGEDYAVKAEIGAGIREEGESSLSPEEYCPSCGEPLPDDAKACARCGTVFTPDAKSAQDAIEDAVHEGAMEADTDAEKDAVNAVRTYIQENPEVAAENPELVEKFLGDE